MVPWDHTDLPLRGITIGSDVFPGLMIVTNRQSHIERTTLRQDTTETGRMLRTMRRNNWHKGKGKGSP